MAFVAKPDVNTYGLQAIGKTFTNQMDQKTTATGGYPVLNRPLIPAPSVYSLINTTTGHAI